jgi:cell division protein FtsB
MDSAWLLKSSTLWGALGISGLTSVLILLVSPDGIPNLRKRQGELREQQRQLIKIHHQNLDLVEEVKRLAARDPELYEALARRQGMAQPGETVYTFQDRGDSR